MFSFNRNEQIAILVLSGALLVGAVVSLLDRYDSGRIEDFDVVKGAVSVPSDSGRTAEGPVADTPDAHAGVPPTASMLVDINRASVVELQKLPRIGPQTAKRIVEHRAKYGSFSSLDDLTAIRGIGAKTVERLRPMAVAGPP